MTLKLAILIPHLTERKKSLSRLLAEYYKQRALLVNPEDVTVLVHEDQRQLTTGTKRNQLIQDAIEVNAQYIAFVDDDDMIGENYLKLNLEGINQGFDTNSLWGMIYWNGKPGKPFHHSIKYDRWFEDKKYYYRCNNHLNCIKLELIKDIKFPDKSWGEDGVWAYAVRDAKVLKTEYQINEVTYHYYAGK